MQDKPTYEDLERRVVELEQAVRDREKSMHNMREEIVWRRRLVEESRDGIVVITPELRVFEANRRFAEMLGYTMEEALMLHVWDWEAHFSRDHIQAMAGIIDGGGHHFETCHRRKDGSVIDVELSNSATYYCGRKLIFCVCRDVTERKRAEMERERLLKTLREADAEIESLRGILPICMYCKKVRDDEGYWEKVEVYLSRYAHSDVSHSICPECMKEHFPGLDIPGD